MAKSNSSSKILTIGIIAVVGYLLLKPKKEAAVGSVLLNENKRIQLFISDWQTKNPYNNNLNEFNKRFKNDLNKFLSNGGFSKQTIESFRIK